MSALTTTHRSAVTEDQIDHLGHMNVRFYGVNARLGGERFIAGLGGSAGLRIEPVDLYTRHHREQLLGAPLEVRTGVLGAGAGTIRLYHELVNTDSGELAATFVHRLVARAAEGPAPQWPPAADLAVVELPEHGRPRSIDLEADPVAASPGLDALRDRALAMRHPRVVGVEECGPDGVVSATDAAGLFWGGEPLEESMGPVLHDGPDGEQIGFASMETRLVVHRLARHGDRVQSFGATVALADKVSQQAMWVFDVDRGDLLATFEVVNLAFDTVARRAVRIPDDLRVLHQRRFHEDLRAR